MKKLLLAVLLLCPLQSIAAEEDWYTYWSLGFSNNSYPEPLDSDLNALESSPGVDRIQGAIDMLGFYWPIQDKLNLGFVISGSFDAFTTPVGNMQINQYLYGASVMKFYGRETGDGLFLRGDLGFAKASITADTPIGTITSTSDTGRGFLIGIGYGIPVSEESRLLLSFNISNKKIEGDDLSTVSFNIGGLW
ncbi:MAG: porin family protein [Gammaproteobacteria bacterium]|nr:porin family protein [Gammaproteobacteria bacterium]